MKNQYGQALTEFLVAATFVLVPLLFLITYVGKTGDIRHRAHESARYAAWEQAITGKTPQQVSYEINRRVLQQDFEDFDSQRDRTRVGTRNVTPPPLYYFSNRNGDYREILEREGGSFASLTVENRDPEGRISDARQSLQNNFLVEYNMPSDGLYNATASYAMASLPYMPQIGRLTPSANNAIYAQPWKSASRAAVRNRIEDAVFGARFLDNSQVRTLSRLSELVGFEEWDDFEPGLIETDPVPCSRVIGGGYDREAACE